MNPAQMAQQIKHKLTTVAWPGGSTDVVFGLKAVHVFAGSPTEAQIPPGFPWCLVSIESGEADEDHPEFITQNYRLISAVNVAGDPLGAHAIVGGAVSELGKSAGRGIAEIAERVRAAVGNLLGSDGAKIMLSLSSTGTPETLGDGRHLTMDSLTLTALCTSGLHYAAPQIIAHDGTDWTWTGSHCSDRFDFKQYRLVRKSGSSASTSPSDGTVVYTGTPATFTGVKTTANTYTVFADYSARKQTDVIEGSSDPEIGSYLVA